MVLIGSQMVLIGFRIYLHVLACINCISMYWYVYCFRKTGLWVKSSRDSREKILCRLRVLDSGLRTILVQVGKLFPVLQRQPLDKDFMMQGSHISFDLQSPPSAGPIFFPFFFRKAQFSASSSGPRAASRGNVDAVPCRPVTQGRFPGTAPQAPYDCRFDLSHLLGIGAAAGPGWAGPRSG